MTGQVHNIIGDGARVGYVVQGHSFTGRIDMNSAGITIHPAPNSEPPVNVDFIAITDQIRSLTAAIISGDAARLISGPELAQLREACSQLAAAADARR